MCGIIKESIRNLLILLIIVAGVILAICWYYSNDNLRIMGWYKFNQQIKKEYKFINDIDFNRNQRVIFITYNVDKDVNLTEIEDVFEETRKFILSDAVFSELEEYQHKKYPNEFYEIYIRFNNSTMGNKNIFEFHSVNGKSEGGKRYEGFYKWDIDIDGKGSKEYSR